MLSDLLEVRQWVLLPLHDCRHSAEGGLLELLASVQAVAELEHPAVVLSDLVDEMPRGVELTEGELVVVLVVQHVQQRGHERVQAVNVRKFGQDLLEPFFESLLGEFDFAHAAEVWSAFDVLEQSRPDSLKGANTGDSADGSGGQKPLQGRQNTARLT